MTETRERVLVIGCGYAGHRFRTAIQYLQRHGMPVDIVGYCDLDLSRVPAGQPGFRDLRAALRELSPTVVCVTVNESAHEQVFTVLSWHDRSLILSEKPLTASLKEAHQAERSLQHHAFSMNLVERFSPIVTECRRWMEAEGPFDVVRVESFWGKHRIGDSRPTMGVLSELIHPLDLTCHLFSLDDLVVVGANGIASDFSSHGTEILETLDVSGRTGEVPVFLHTSFSWPTRRRQISALLWSPVKGMFRIDMNFDSPHWDCDAIEIFSISISGRFSRVHESRISNEEVPAEIKGVSKVTHFAEQSIWAWRGEVPGHHLVSLQDAVHLQAKLHDIERSSRCSLITANYRKAAP